jgi:hypothetical protein
MFLKKISNFLIMLMIALLACLLLNKFIVDKLLSDESKLPDHTKWIAFGDSHIANSINPEEFPWLVNRAHSGERLLYNFEKIQYYIENNPQIELVILGYWVNTMQYDEDWLLYGKDAQYRYESYLPLQLFNGTDVSYLDVPENSTLYWENYWGYKIGYPSPAVKIAVKNFLTCNNNLEMKGGFLKGTQTYSEKAVTHNKDTTTIAVDSLALKNLNDVVTYLKEKNVKLVFLNTPATKEFFRPINDSHINVFNKIVSSYVDNKNVWYLNFSNYKLHNKYFNDLHHLNFNGANYFTPILIDSILNITTIKNSK